MRYKIIYSDAISAIIRGEIAGTDRVPGDAPSTKDSKSSDSCPAGANSEVVCWPAGYVSEIRASLSLIESHVGLLLNGTASLIAEHAHAYLRKIQRAADQVRILTQSQLQAAIPLETCPNGPSSAPDNLPAGSVDEITASLDAIEHALELLLHGHSMLLPVHRKAFLRNIQNAATQLRTNLGSQSGQPRETVEKPSREKLNLSQIATTISQQLAAYSPERKVDFLIVPNATATGDIEILTAALGNLFEHAWNATAPLSRARIEFGFEDTGVVRTFHLRDNREPAGAAGNHSVINPAADLDCGQNIEIPAKAANLLVQHGARVWARTEPGYGVAVFFIL